MAAILLGVLAAFSWSLHDLIARSFALRIGPFRMAAWVMVAGGAFLTGIVLWNGSVWQASRSGIAQSLLLGLAYGFGAGGLFKALSLGPIAIVGPVTASYPVLVVLWGVANGLLPSSVQWAAVAATIAGAIVVTRDRDATQGGNAVRPEALPGLMAYCALSCIGYASAVVLGQNAAVAIGEVEATWLSRPAALCAILPFVLREPRRPRIAGRHWLGIAAMGALDVLGVVAINASGHLPGREFAAVGISSYAAIAVVLAMLVLRETVSASQWVGIVLIVAGVAALSLTQ
jgi:drug/metabolite transporter (DMT)-like permease